MSAKQNRVKLSPRQFAEYKRGVKLFESFTGHKGGAVEEIDAPIVPRTAIVIGYCDGILYSTVRDGKRENYIHEFEHRDRPTFAVSPDGKQILLLGGAYDFTERGIVDRHGKK